MNHNLHSWFFVLLLLIFLAAFFSAAEIGMMSINRYRLRHLVRKNIPAAKRVSQMLERPDRLLGVILIGNNFATILASAVATIIAVKLFGDVGVAVATVLLTFIILIFAEITPKTLAALYPEKIAFPISLPLKILLIVFYPVVWIVNSMSNGLLRIFGIKLKKGGLDAISHEELRTIVREATGKTGSSQEMLLSILDLQKVSVEDILVPRNKIVGIDLENSWDEILNQLKTVQHTRLPLYRDDIDHVEGMLHLRRALNLMSENQLTKDNLLAIADPVYFVPEGTPLNIQLVNFRQLKARSALVVDEYGEILGLVTLEDILEEIVGEFTTSLTTTRHYIAQQKDGSYLIDGAVSVRELNRTMNWELPIPEATRTLNGLVVEYLEMIPTTPICLKLNGYPMEVIELEENRIKLIRLWPKKFIK